LRQKMADFIQKIVEVVWKKIQDGRSALKTELVDITGKKANGKWRR
jgi:hypothetical protein